VARVHVTPTGTGDVVAIIPAYQAATTLADVVEAAAHHVPVIVVDDGSTDDTAMVAERAGARVLRQRPNRGKGAALRMGVRHALDEGHEAVLTLDADGQHDPSRIPAFLQAWRARCAPLVIGQRDFSRMPLSRRVANELGTRVFSWAVGRHIADNQSGFRLVARPLLPLLLESDEDGFEFEVEMITLAIRAGLAIDWVPIPTIYEAQGSHIRPLAHVRHFLRVAWAARRSVGKPIDAEAGTPPSH
jgi:glycosyltransferase involved in cell wall biosynthesis